MPKIDFTDDKRETTKKHWVILQTAQEVKLNPNYEYYLSMHSVDLSVLAVQDL